MLLNAIAEDMNVSGNKTNRGRMFVKKTKSRDDSLTMLWRCVNTMATTNSIGVWHRTCCVCEVRYGIMFFYIVVHILCTDKSYLQIENHIK